MEHGEKLKIISLIGNKNDKYLEEEVDEKSVKEFADEIQAVYKKTSALDNTGIEDLFDELISKYIKEIGGFENLNAGNEQKDDKIVIEKNGEKGRKKKNCC